MSTPASPFADHAAPILAGDPVLTDEQRADLWDAFHTKNPEELVQHLQLLNIPDDTKQRLYDAKKRSIPPVIDPLDKTAAAIQKMVGLDPQTLAIAEAHPAVLKAFTSAATTPAKGAGEAQGKTSPASGSSTSSATEKPATTALPPRPDGLEHLPPIPDGHHRVLASDGGIHDIPAENLQQATEIDPRLHVLNPNA